MTLNVWTEWKWKKLMADLSGAWLDDPKALSELIIIFRRVRNERSYQDAANPTRSTNQLAWIQKIFISDKSLLTPKMETKGLIFSPNQSLWTPKRETKGLILAPIKALHRPGCIAFKLRKVVKNILTPVIFSLVARKWWNGFILRGNQMCKSVGTAEALCIKSPFQLETNPFRSVLCDLL